MYLASFIDLLCYCSISYDAYILEKIKNELFKKERVSFKIHKKTLIHVSYALPQVIPNNLHLLGMFFFRILSAHEFNSWIIRG